MITVSMSSEDLFIFQEFPSLLSGDAFKKNKKIGIIGF